MKKVKGLLVILLSIILLTVLVLAYVNMPNRTCSQVVVSPHSENSSIIVTQEDIEEILRKSGIEIIGKQQKEINFGEISAAVKTNPYVEKINFVNVAGNKLMIDFDLRNIKLNVTTIGGENYFVDSKGIVVPFTHRMTDYVMVVNGNIPDEYTIGKTANKKVQEALKIENKIEENDFYRAQFRQIYINGSNEPELMSTIGGQNILLGDAENLDEKLANVKTVYENALSHKGYNTYCQLDARFKNRIIATKHK